MLICSFVRPEELGDEPPVCHEDCAVDSHTSFAHRTGGLHFQSQLPSFIYKANDRPLDCFLAVSVETLENTISSQCLLDSYRSKIGTTKSRLNSAKKTRYRFS